VPVRTNRRGSNQLDGGRFRTPSQHARRRHRLQRAGDDLGGAGAIGRIHGFGLEKFGMRKNDPELIIQSVKHLAQVRLDLGI
jgi:hypothetical protein